VVPDLEEGKKFKRNCGNSLGHRNGVGESTFDAGREGVDVC